MNRHKFKTKLQISKTATRSQARSQAIKLIGLENVKKLEAVGLMVVDEQEWVRRIIREEAGL